MATYTYGVRFGAFLSSTPVPHQSHVLRVNVKHIQIITFILSASGLAGAIPEAKNLQGSFQRILVLLTKASTSTRLVKTFTLDSMGTPLHACYFLGDTFLLSYSMENTPLHADRKSVV